MPRTFGVIILRTFGVIMLRTFGVRLLRMFVVAMLRTFSIVMLRTFVLQCYALWCYYARNCYDAANVAGDDERAADFFGCPVFV